MALRIAMVAALVLLAAACSAEKATPPATPDLEASIDLGLIPAFTYCGSDAEAPLCDPVDLLFPDTDFAVVAAALIGAGWSVAGLGSVETVIDPGTSQSLQPSVQLFETEGRGVAAPRYHVRLWQLANGDTVGAVHHETGGTEHSIDLDWEAAEDRVVADLCGNNAFCRDGGVIAEQQRRQENTEQWRGFRNDWRPAVFHLTRPG
jgi:hypothetical protein